MLTSLATLLLGVNPRTGKPDHVLNMTRFVFYGHWLPEARTFSEALDAEEEPEAEVPDSVPGAEDAAMTRPCPHHLSRTSCLAST